VKITIEPLASSPAAGGLGTAYEIGPAGTKFAAPVRVTFTYGEATLAGRTPIEVRVGTLSGGAWMPLSAPSSDITTKTIAGSTTHLSPFSLYLAASGMSCGDVAKRAASVTCASGSTTACEPYPGSAVGACADVDGGFDATCCFPAGQAPCLAVSAAATCSASTPCAGYAGSTLNACTDDPKGYQATCCFPQGATPPPVVLDGGG